MPASLKIRNKKIETKLQKGKSLEEKQKEKEDKPALSPLMMAILLFVVCGSAIVGIVANARQAWNLGQQAQMQLLHVMVQLHI